MFRNGGLVNVGEYMKVSEIYPALQAEGPSAGQPFLIIRTAGCNVHCPECDSKFTWDSKNSVDYSFDKLWMMVVKYTRDTESRNVLITGGEPLLQQNGINGLYKLVQKLILNGYWVEVETNGTLKWGPSQTELYHAGLLSGYTPSQFNISPKLPSFAGHELNLAVLRDFMDYDYIFKFVVGSKSDLSVVRWLTSSLKIPNNKIWLMPKGFYKKDVFKHSPWIWKYCVENGLNYSPRLHIMLFGYKRGF